VSMAKWARFCIHKRQEMPGSSEQGRKLRGLCIPRSLPRVGTTPIRSRACRQHIFLKIATAGAKVPGPGLIGHKTVLKHL
jgi:hypothetical protein